jgi:hypothetical protein
MLKNFRGSPIGKNIKIKEGVSSSNEQKEIVVWYLEQ